MSLDRISHVEHTDTSAMYTSHVPPASTEILPNYNILDNCITLAVSDNLLYIQKIKAHLIKVIFRGMTIIKFTLNLLQ